MAVRIDWTDDGTPQSPFLRHTPYIPLDTVELREAIEWNGCVYAPGRCPAYIIERDLPGKLVRELFKRKLARPGCKLWENQEPFKYFVEDESSPLVEIHIASHSLTNFYSIPRFFQPVYSPTGLGHKAAHVHDVLCDHSLVVFKGRSDECYEAMHPVNDREAAHIFHEAQQVALVPPAWAWWKYQAVRFGGPVFDATAWQALSIT